MTLKLRIAQHDFADAVTWVARSIPSRPPIPVLGGVLLTADDTGLTVSGFDYEVSAQMRTAAEILGQGQALVSGRLLASIVKALPNKPVEVDANGNGVNIACGTAKFALPTMPVEDYPQLPGLPERTGSLPGELFAEAVAQTAVAAAHDDALPMLTGIRAEIQGPVVTLAATDRFRLAVRRVAWTPTRNDLDTAVLVPASTLLDAAKTFASAPDATVDVLLGADQSATPEGLLGLVGGTRRMTTRLLDAEFPKFRSLLPASFPTTAATEVGPLIEAIKRIALVSDRGAQVRLEFTAEGLRLVAGGDDLGRAEEHLEADLRGDAITIAFNPGYLIDGLQALRHDQVLFGLTAPTRPAVLHPAPDRDLAVAQNGAYLAPDSDFVYLLMPVRIPGESR